MKTTINYVFDRGDGVVPFLLDTAWTGASRVPVEVEIADARPIAPNLSLDREGFILSHIVSGVTDYRDWTQLETLWVPAAIEMVKRVSGASWGTAWACNTRFSERSGLSTITPVAAPARVAHADLRPAFNPARIGDEPVSEVAAKAVKLRYGNDSPQRWRVFNVWQQISPPPQDTPLAVCDLSSVDEKDILDGQASDGKRTVSLTLFQRNPRHRWYYFSNLLPGEALVFSGLDPAAGPKYAQVPHVAFDLEPCPTSVVPRSSIEVRVLAAFDGER